MSTFEVHVSCTPGLEDILRADILRVVPDVCFATQTETAGVTLGERRRDDTTHLAHKAL